jgi:hypothetical protein
MEGTMGNPVAEIEKVLREETDHYTALYELEFRKGKAIEARDGKRLESVSMEQDCMLSRIGALEERRRGLVEKYARMNGLIVTDRPVSLREVVALMDGVSGQRLMVLGEVLKKMILKLDSLQKTNSVLIRDNLDFFNTMLSSFKSAVAISGGYSEKGFEKSKVAGSLLINHTA